jgi:hypothetical protein
MRVWGWRIALLASLAAVAAAQPVAAQVASPGATGVPKTMVGTWSRYVSKKSYTHFGDRSGKYGMWLMKIAKTGLVSLYQPKSSLSDTPSIQGSLKVTGAKVTVRAGCPTTNTYRWKRHGRLLTFTYVSDAQCRDRAAVMSGYWKKRS